MDVFRSSYQKGVLRDTPLEVLHKGDGGPVDSDDFEIFERRLDVEGASGVREVRHHPGVMAFFP